MGVVVSAVGVGLSFQLDLPTGAAIVATFGAALLIVAAYRRAFRRAGAGAEASPAVEREAGARSRSIREIGFAGSRRSLGRRTASSRDASGIDGIVFRLGRRFPGGAASLGLACAPS